jgi:glycosyltransferase involved in cell wall biosynthesis
LPSDAPATARVAYVVKVYPRFSETFIVNELLAHERAGTELEIVALRPPTGGRFHPDIGAVHAPVTYLPHAGVRALALWMALRGAGPGAAALLEDPDAADPRDAHQAVLLAHHVRERGITHLHAHFASAAGTVTRLAARMAGITYSITAHAKDIFHDDVEPVPLAQRLSDAHAVVTVSDFNAEYLRRLAPAARVHRVYNGVDLRAFAYAPGAAEPLRIVAVGRLVEKKGFGDLVEACHQLAAAGRDVRCQIVGDGDLEPELRAQIAEHGLERRVELLGPRTQDEVRALVREAAVLAAPCIVGADGNRDGLPTVLLEAMALGTPVVSTDVTGIPELVRHEQTGLITGQHDPAGLAAALARLLDDAALRDRLAAAGRALIEECFDVDRSAQRVRAVAWPGPPTAPADPAPGELAEVS